MDLTQNQLGYIDQSDLKPSSTAKFRPIAVASNLSDCYNQSLNTGSRFMAFNTQSQNDWNCYVGDSTDFNRKTGIATYVIPKPNENISQLKYQLINDNLQKDIQQKQSALQKNQAALYCAQNGYAIDDSCQTKYNQYMQQQDAANRQAEIDKEEQRLQQRQKEIEEQAEMQRQLLDEKNKIRSMKDERIKKNNNDLDRLDRKLLTMTQIIKNTQFKYKLNDSMVYILTIFIIAFIIIIALVMAYNGYFYLKHV